MLILTQDGCRVVKFKDIINLAVSYDDNDNYTIYCDTNNDYDLELGTYKDKERCKEVLKEITHRYNSLKKDEVSMFHGYTSSLSYVYKMPEE